MRFPKKDPSKGQEKACTWSLENWKERKSAAGWLQLPPVWIETHHYFVTVPCHSFMTAGKLECPWCKKCRPLEDSAYVAWVDESGKPYASCFKKYARPILAKLRVNDPILLGKGGDKFSPVWVKPREKSYQWVPSPGTERTPEQFEQWLLRVWKAPELVEFYGLPQPEPEPAPLRPAEVKVKRFEREYAAWKRGEGERPNADDMTEFADVIPLIESMGAARNGTHKK